MIACGSLDLEVPRRNLRSFSLVSGEKEYNRDSDWEMSAISTLLEESARGLSRHAVWSSELTILYLSVWSARQNQMRNVFQI